MVFPVLGYGGVSLGLSASVVDAPMEHASRASGSSGDGQQLQLVYSLGISNGNSFPLTLSQVCIFGTNSERYRSFFCFEKRLED